MPRIRGYYDALYGLVPVKSVNGFSCARARSTFILAEVTEDTRAYKKGEILEIFERDFVKLAPKKGYFIRVSTIQVFPPAPTKSKR